MNKKETKTKVEVQDDGSIVTSTTTITKEPIYSEAPKIPILPDAPINRIILYSDYYITRYDNAKGIRITLTEEAVKAGKTLHDILKGSFTAPSEAMKFIDHVEGNKKRLKTTIVYDAKGSGYMQDTDTQAYYNLYG